MAQPADIVGTKIGKYAITAELAAGGMGIVYLARHEIIDRDAVVKVLHARFSNDADVVRRFFNEAKAAASIHHPGIVEIFDMDRDADGRAYIVMEYLQGETLAERIRSRPIALDAAVGMARQLVGALGAAHDRGIIHRDLKPDNVFVVPDPDVPGGERVKVLDFGIAKLAEYTGSIKTQAGSIFGTPAYMSPEQCEDAANVDHRADIYALGCIFYELLTGQPPFGHGGLALLAAHMRDDPPALRSRNPAIPPELDALVLRMLAKNPADRPQTCREVFAGLEAPHLKAGLEAPPGATVDPGAVPTTRTGTAIAFAGTMLTGGGATDSGGRTGTLAGISAAPPGTLHPGEPREDALADGDTAAGVPAGLTATSATVPGGDDGTRAAEDARDDVREPDSEPERRRGWLVAVIALLAVAGVAVAGVVVLGGGRDESGAFAADAGASADDAAVSPAPAMLEEARRAIADMRWDDADAALDRALAADPGNAEATAMRERVDRERTNAATYDKFLASGKSGDVKAMVEHFANIPEDSVYRELARDNFQPIRAVWLNFMRERAAEDLARTRCSALVKIVADVDELFPDAKGEFEAMVDECQKKQRDSKPKPKPGDKPDKPGDKPDKPGDKPDKPGDKPDKPGDKPDKPDDRPEQLGRRQLLTTLAQVTPRLAGCLGGRDRRPRRARRLPVSLDIEPSGAVKSVTVRARNEQLARCAEDIIRGVKFPAARKPTRLDIQVPVRFRRGR